MDIETVISIAAIAGTCWMVLLTYVVVFKQTKQIDALQEVTYQLAQDVCTLKTQLASNGRVSGGCAGDRRVT